MEEVVCKVVTNVAEDSTTEHGCCGIPIVKEDCVGELVEWCCKGNEKGGWHDKAVFIHRQVVVDSVEKEVTCDADSVVWKVSEEELVASTMKLH